MQSSPLIVAVFWHSPVRLRAEHRRLFARDLPWAEEERLLRTTGVAFRQNLARVLAGAAVAQKYGGVLVGVEGWRIQQVGGWRRLTGSELTARMLVTMRRRGWLAPGLETSLVNHSRCTREEIAGVLRVAGDFGGGGRRIAITSHHCPSLRRLRHYLNGSQARDVEVLDPLGALERHRVKLPEEATRCLAALALSPAEQVVGALSEAISWGLHGVSSMLEFAGLPHPPLETRVARRLRRDQPAFDPRFRRTYKS